MNNHIIFVHGRKPKPEESVLKDLWCEAILHGLREDHEADVVNAFIKAEKSMAYYADKSLDILAKHYLDDEEDENERAQLYAKLSSSRRKTLDDLKNRDRASFNEETYEGMCEPRETLLSLREAAVKILIDGVNLVGANIVPVKFIGSQKRDLDHFWDRSEEYGREVRDSFREPLTKALSDEDGRVLVISHSLGTMVAYDCFWSFSWDPEDSSLSNRVVDTWVTLGSPLGAGFVKSKLFGADERGDRRWPSNVKKWFNFAAEDDYISSDEDVKNDFRRMIDRHSTEIQDKKIYSLAKRYSLEERDDSDFHLFPDGKLHPHSELGYLIHPDVSATIADWLRG